MTQFEKDLNVPINNGKMSLGIYNLLVSKRDLNIFANLDMKPHRHWKFNEVKKYFGIKGNKHKVAEIITQMVEERKPKKVN